KSLAADGARVVCVDLPTMEDALNELADDINGTALGLDIAASDAAQVIRKVADEGLDILVHNAGITRDKTLAKMRPEWWYQTIDINLGAVIRVTDDLLKDGLNDAAHVVCLSS